MFADTVLAVGSKASITKQAETVPILLGLWEKIQILEPFKYWFLGFSTTLYDGGNGLTTPRIREYLRQLTVPFAMLPEQVIL